jgi:hypothetical protein
MDNLNSTTQVVREAMKITSKDVRVPKAVRDGLVNRKMIKKIQTQKIYTFPDRKLYGEFCLLSLAELRLQIIKGEIKEQLCFIDENDRAYVYDKWGVPDGFPDFYIGQKHTNLLHQTIKAQCKLREEKEL